MALALDRGPQDVGDLLRQLNDLREQINAFVQTADFGGGPVGTAFYSNGVLIGDIVGDGTTVELDLYDPSDPSNTVALFISDGVLNLSSTVPVAINFAPGFAFADLPVPDGPGMVVMVTNSSTQVWGATIAAASPGNPVLACFMGSVWTVIGK